MKISLFYASIISSDHKRTYRGPLSTLMRTLIGRASLPGSARKQSHCIQTSRSNSVSACTCVVDWTYT